MSNESGPKAGVEGVVEDVKGKVKEVAGRVTGNEDLEAGRNPRPPLEGGSDPRRPVQP